MKLVKRTLLLAPLIFFAFLGIISWSFYSHNIDGYMLGVRTIIFGLIGYMALGGIAIKSYFDVKAEYKK